MGHCDGNKYHLKLNKNDSSYESLINDIQDEINKKKSQYEANPVESFSSSIKKENNELVVIFSSYKSGVSTDLSFELIKNIKNNVLSSPDSYYYQEDNGNLEGSIRDSCGYANKVFKSLVDAQYHPERNYEIFSDIFKECLVNCDALDEIIKEGEKTRFLNHFYSKDIHVSYKSDFSPNTGFYQNNSIHEKWLAYFLVYGTDTKFSAHINPVHKGYVNLKEMLYANDTDLNGGKWGQNTLITMMKHGVTFKEGLDSIDANFYKFGRSGYLSKKADKEEIENWYQQNKVVFSETPKFNNETLDFLSENFPTTLENLTLKIEELENNIKNKEIICNTGLERK